ncbi:probable protein phosphatase 2C 51 [Cornus florida]|uniref:probable protein phosphatase 2C 51 n=1 Tax=Cornus florida TaxID=4283 RepID=UPI00289F55EB|nr:probable protein phosphatase 2C 51 [Cornus florida]
MEILKEALLRTIKDIDLTFTEEALRNNLPSGSTAVIALLVDGQILVANVGDSKALLCSEKIDSHQDAKGTLMAYLSAKELTRDHNANREEERARIEAAGGFIFEWDVPLVNGHFPMTRAIGDVPLKKYGIIPVPELTDWQPLTANDSYLVVASDGIFESLSPQNVCDLLSDAHLHRNRRLKLPSSCSSLADCIVRTAFERGSTDNLSVVVVPMGTADFSQEPSEKGIM